MKRGSAMNLHKPQPRKRRDPWRRRPPRPSRRGCLLPFFL